jgi:Tol biopolymer transport system component
LLRGIPSRFTKDPAPDTNPLWSPDGSRIVFSASRGGVADLYQKIASGAGNEEVLLNSGESKVPDDWSSDGQFIVYETPNPKTKQDCGCYRSTEIGSHFRFCKLSSTNIRLNSLEMENG